MTTPFQREQQRIKKQLEDKNAQIDAGADGFLEKLRASKWTGALLLLAAAVLVVVLWWLAG